MGFVLTESEFCVDYANQAFVEMVGAELQDDVRGNPLTRWLRLTEVDLARLHAHSIQRQATALLTVELCPTGKRARRVEVCAVPVADDHTHNSYWGFTVDFLPRLN